MATNKLTTEAPDFMESEYERLAAISRSDPNELSPEQAAELAGLSPDRLNFVYDRVPTRNTALVSVVAGVAMVGAREAMLAVPPKPDVARRYLSIVAKAFGNPQFTDSAHLYS